MLQSVRRHLPFLLATLCLATVMPGLFLPFEDSEIWGITSSRRIIDHPFIGSSAHYKPLFSLLFGFVASIAKSDWSALMASRWLVISFAAGGLFSLYSIGLTFIRNDRSKALTIAMYSIVCTMPLILLHFTKARSDTVSASLILIAGFLLVRLEHRSTLFRGLFYLGAAGIALLITPKSIDLAVALAVIFWITEYKFSSDDTKAEPKNTLQRRITWLAGPVVFMLLLGLIFSREFLVKSFVYWLDSYKGGDLFSPVTWYAFRNAVHSAIIPSALIGSGLVVGLISFRRLSIRERALVVIGWIVAIFILIHSQKFPFFLASRAPFLALGALPGLHEIFGFLLKRTRLRESLVLGGFALLFVASIGLTAFRISQYPAFSLSEQKTVYLQLEQYLERTKVKWYWDAIGLFPTRNLIFHYPSPGDRENSEMLNYVEQSRPILILRTSKMELLEPNFMMWLKPRYAAVDPQIYVRYKRLSATENCNYSAAEVIRIARNEKFEVPVALIKKGPTDQAWIRIPFRSEAGLLNQIEANTTASVRLDQCERSDMEYAITEAGPWDALPAPSFSRSFGYDGRL